MTMTLYWEIPTPTDYSNTLSDRLKHILRAHFDQPSLNIMMGRAHLDFLEGLKAADIPDADVLIDLIEQHEKIHLYEQS